MRPRDLPRNVWATSLTSFLTDVSSEMLANVLPLFLANVVGVRAATIGLIEGVAESVASLLKLLAGALSDRLGVRKPLAVGGYAISAAAKPLFYLATTWSAVAGIRWAERVGKGIRSAPRDALLADSVAAGRRGLAFGLHRAADTAGAVVGILAAIAVVVWVQGGDLALERRTFQILVVMSAVPALLAVVVLAALAKDVPVAAARGGTGHRAGRKRLGRGFVAFAAVLALFELGNSSDAFLILRAQERGLTVAGVLWVLLGFNAVYALVATPAGALSDRLSRRAVLAWSWGVYALVYLGFSLAEDKVHVALLFSLYGGYHGMAAGAAKAMVADLVPADLRGTAFGWYHAVVGVMALPASLAAGIVWQGVGHWPGWGPAAPFVVGAFTAVGATALLLLVVPERADQPESFSPPGS